MFNRHEAATINDNLQKEFGADILALMADKSITDIMINPNGQVWLKKEGINESYFYRNFDVDSSFRIIRMMSTVIKIDNIDTTTLIEGKLPFNGCRFTGILPPTVDNPMIVVRMPAVELYTLDDYVATGRMTQQQKNRIENAIHADKTIMVVGGTGSGKTTLLNSLVDVMIKKNASERIVVIQDTQEIQTKGDNVVFLTSNNKTSLEQLLTVTLRVYPKRIILGEVRERNEAYQLLKAWNTGHKGGVCSIHADDCMGGLHRLEGLVHEVTKRDMKQQVANTIDVLIFMDDVCGVRVVSEIKEVSFSDGEYVLV
jgi:type IV secretion system protein TrbB